KRLLQSGIIVTDDRPREKEERVRLPALDDERFFEAVGEMAAGVAHLLEHLVRACRRRAAQESGDQPLHGLPPAGGGAAGGAPGAGAGAGGLAALARSRSCFCRSRSMRFFSRSMPLRASSMKPAAGSSLASR